MHWIDWLIVLVPLLIVAGIGLYTQRYVRGVSDFLAAGRVAGRYVVAVANGEAGLGLISVVAILEMFYRAGFAVQFWGAITTPISLLVLLTGFGIYRFRETRAMTLAQFFEIRYNKTTRLMAGVFQSVSGIINYGLFPAVGARFLMYFCNLPANVEFLGLTWPTFALLMAGFLGLAVLIATLGGQITVMTTDCVQGILSYPMYLAVVAAILWKFSWGGQIAPTLLDRPPGESMLNPYDVAQLRDFNLFYVMVGIFGNVYNMMSWSGTQGYNAAAATPHEQKMGRILGTWRSGFSGLMIVLLAVAAYTYMHHTDFSTQARKTEQNLSWKTLNDVAYDEQYAEAPPSEELIEQRVSELKAGQDLGEHKKHRVYETIHDQMRVPVALRDILPIGVTGAFCAIMIFLMISTDTSYLHSWGSILIQDIILPFRRKPFTPRQQLLVLRLAITFVAVFGFFFSYFFGQVTYILMFFQLTGAIWMGGAGAVILGGLYWKRGTTAGAITTLIVGATIGILGCLGTNYWAGTIYPWLTQHPELLTGITRFLEGASRPFEPYIQWRVTPDKFPINGQEVAFITMMTSVLLYVIVSLLTCRKPFNMKRMLHRGAYRREADRVEGAPLTEKPPRTLRGVLRALLGIDEQFTRGDRILSWSVFLYSFGWGFGSWLTLVIWNLISPWPEAWWATWFFIANIIVASTVGIVSTVWFTLGGIWDLRRMFRRLAKHEANVLDDGRVIGHMNVDDIARVEQIEHRHVSEDDEG